MKHERNRNRETMIIISFAVLPFQKRHLKEIAVLTRKTQSELGREALSFLFGQYSYIFKRGQP